LVNVIQFIAVPKWSHKAASTVFEIDNFFCLIVSSSLFFAVLMLMSMLMLSTELDLEDKKAKSVFTQSLDREIVPPSLTKK